MVGVASVSSQDLEDEKELRVETTTPTQAGETLSKDYSKGGGGFSNNF